MKILFLISNLHFGGAEKQVVLQANLLGKQHEVSLVYFREGPLLKLIEPSVKVQQFGMSNYFLQAWRLIHYVRKNKLDLIHASLFSALMISALSGPFHQAKVIWHFHSHEYEITPLNKTLLSFLSRFVDKVLFVSQELRQFINDFGFNFSAAKQGILYNFSLYDQQVAKAVKVKLEPIIIGYVGRLVDLKRVHLLVDTAAYLVERGLKNFVIQIVGDGVEKEKISQLIKDKNLESYIELKGFHKEVLPFYQSFNLFINPSEEECLSLAIIDACILGIPAIAFDVGGNPEIILHGETGYIVDDAQQLYERTEQLMASSVLREQMGKKARQYCMEHFSQQSHLQELNALYKSLKLS